MFMSCSRRHASRRNQLGFTLVELLVVIAIVAAVLPGGDPVSMLMLMVPQIILYVVGIWLASVFGRPAPWSAGEATTGPSENPA